MGLRRLLLLLRLLLHLHLEESVSLPAPSNVTISSFNMEHTLSFLPALQTPSSARFAVEILRLRRRKWKPVAGCLELMPGQTCNLTQAFKDPFDHYRARVKTFTPDRTSEWTVSGQFQPLTDTVLGPPEVSVSGCGKCLLLQIRDPPSRGLQHMKDFHRELDLQVRRTRDKAQFKLTQHFKEEIKIEYLQPGVEYCVTVSVKTLFNSKTVTSQPHCAFTSPPLPSSSHFVVYGILGACCTIGPLLVGFVVYGRKRGSRFLRRRLSSTLVTDPVLGLQQIHIQAFLTLHHVTFNKILLGLPPPRPERCRGAV